MCAEGNGDQDIKIPDAYASGILALGVAVPGVGFFRTEKQRQAPKRRKAHNRVDDAGNPGSGAAADECHQVEVEQSDDTLVQPANDGQGQRNLV